MTEVENILHEIERRMKTDREILQNATGCGSTLVILLPKEWQKGLMGAMPAIDKDAANADLQEASRKTKETEKMRKKFGMVLKKPTRNLRMALRYWFPKRLTLECNPRIHAWVWWNF